jgi:hypothetical protein
MHIVTATNQTMYLHRELDLPVHLFDSQLVLFALYLVDRIINIAGESSSKI